MEFLTNLWMPILASAVFVFIASFITHMILPIHKGEFKKLTNEDSVMEVLSSVPAGRYMMPCPETMGDWKSPEFEAKMDKGPNGMITVWAGKTNMGQNLLLTFLFYILVGIFVAYISWHSFGGEQTEYLDRFRIAGAVAFAAHGLGWMSFIIWYKANSFWPNFIDALIYALVTAGTFAWLWPK